MGLEKNRILGGNTRNQSLYKALQYIEKRWGGCENIFIHEAARPFLTKEIVDEYIKKLAFAEGIITTQHIVDSLGKKGQHIVNREEYYLIQAPEAFKYTLLMENFSPDSEITATSQHLPASTKIEHYYGFKNNFKITYPEDLYFAEQYMRMKQYEKE